jgi:hypothetical protein
VRALSAFTSTISLYHWTIRDKASHVYTFTTAFSLKPGATVYVHTGSGANTSVHRYWGSKAYIWNNTGDTAYLRNTRATASATSTAERRRGAHRFRPRASAHWWLRGR